MRRSTRDYYLNERGSNNDDHDDNNNINNDNINNKDWTKSGRGKCLVLPLVSYCFERTKSPLTWNGKGGGEGLPFSTVFPSFIDMRGGYPNNYGSLYLSGKLPTYASPKKKFWPK